MRINIGGIIEEFGRFNRMMKPGLNIVNPCTEEIRLIDLKIQVSSAGSGEYMTKDNVKIIVKSSIAYRITNPILSYYILGEKINKALVELTISSLRNVIG